MKITPFISLVSFALVAWSTNAQAASGTPIPAGSVATTFTISKSGAYYLSGERVMTDNTKNAITIAADDVTLDLNGYSISFSNNASGTGNAIAGTTVANIEVRNGSITNTPNAGVLLATSTSQIRVVDVRVSGALAGVGIGVGESSSVRHCEVVSCHDGIWTNKASTITDCHISFSPGNGIYANGTGCFVKANNIFSAGKNGIIVGDYGLVEDNLVVKCNSPKNPDFAGIVLNGQYCVAHNNDLNQNGLCSVRTWWKCTVEGNTCTSGESDHVALKTDTTSMYRNNSIHSPIVTNGSWINGGGNVVY